MGCEAGSEVDNVSELLALVVIAYMLVQAPCTLALGVRIGLL